MAGRCLMRDLPWTAFTVAAVVVYLPVLAFLGGNPYVFFLYRFNTATAALVVVAFLLLPTALLLALAWAWDRSVGRGVHALLLAVMFLVLARQLDIRFVSPWAQEMGNAGMRLGVFAAAALPLIVLRQNIARHAAAALHALRWPALVVVLWQTTVVGQPIVSRLVDPGADAAATPGRAAHNIYVILIDGFPFEYVATPDGFPDPAVAPRLAAFAREDAIWASNNGANATWTLLSAPSILSGTVPATDGNGIPAAASNLLNLAERTYDVWVFAPSLNVPCVPDRYRCYPRPRDPDPILTTRMIAANYFVTTEPRLARFFDAGGTINWRTYPFEAADVMQVLPMAVAEIRKGLPDGQFMFIHTFFELPAASSSAPTEEKVADARRLVARWDETFGEFLDALQSSGAYGQSIVAVVSDHGKDYSQAEPYGPRAEMTRRIVRTPLGVKPLGSGGARVVTRPTQNLDLLPTIVELAGWMLPPGLAGSLAGRSLLSDDDSARPHLVHVRALELWEWDWAVGTATPATASRPGSR